MLVCNCEVGCTCIRNVVVRKRQSLAWSYVVLGMRLENSGWSRLIEGTRDHEGVTCSEFDDSSFQ